MKNGENGANGVVRPDDANLQGFIVRGYKHHSCSSHMLFNFPDKPSARALIGALAPYVQSGADWGANRPERMLNIGFTYKGLAIASDLTADDFNYNFPLQFTAGPVGRASLRDVGPSDPKNWWGGRFTTDEIHCIVHAYAQTPESLATFVTLIAGAAAKAGVRELFPLEREARLEQQFLPDGQVHFGYRDGISEPALGWPSAWPPDVDFTPADTLNNFVIGYPGSRAYPGPYVTSDPRSVRAAAFAKDGCYLAFRVLSQDIAGFEAFLDAHAQEVATAIGKPVDFAREWLAAKLMGRWRNGSPLSVSPDAPEEKTRDDADFSFTGDDSGAKCPLASHARVSNPRDQKMNTSDQHIPRLIRRGVPYGPPLGAEPTGGDRKNADRGLIGLFLCGSLSLQFEKIYGWFQKNDFSPLFPHGKKTQDAVVADRSNPGVDTSFHIPTPSGEIRLDLKQFIVTRGTAYLFVPSIASLRGMGGGA